LSTLWSPKVCKQEAVPLIANQLEEMGECPTETARKEKPGTVALARILALSSIPIRLGVPNYLDLQLYVFHAV